MASWGWDSKIQEARYSGWYSTKLPMKIIRWSGAGFQKANGLHYNPHVSLIPSKCLQEQIFPWLDEAKGEILQQFIVVSILDLNTTDTRHINTPAFVLGSSNFKLPANPKPASEIWNQ